ncbi:MAG: hypothetical protein GY788_25015 [bacterium]|nr:hypothetical protein [bacterium]
MTSPRVFGIPATQAPVVAVIRRGPSDWTHIGAWRTDTDTYEPGAWLRGTIYPQKCDLSADGRLFAYSAMKQPGDWPAGAVYEAISRLPWLTALAAWGSGTTYTRGVRFAAAADSDVGEPDVGDAPPLGLRWNRPVQFCVERRRGWIESEDTPPRADGGPWDENRRVEMTKSQPRGRRLLHVDGRYTAFRAGDPGAGVSYWMTEDEDIAALDVQWADWDRDGDLLVATSAGVLQRRNLTTGVTTDVMDLNQLRPRPQPAPDWAHSW